MLDQKKPVQYKDKGGRRHGSDSLFFIICIIIFAYLLVYSLVYFFNTGISMYTVVSGRTAGKYENQYTALIMRDETVVESSLSGYINFLSADASSIYVGESVYIIDESGELSAAVQKAASDMSIMDENDLSSIRSDIYDFDTSFSAENYYDTYSFKYKLESQILELVNSSVFGGLTNTDSYSIIKSDIAGIIIHSIDGFEGLTLDSIEANSFKKVDYNKTITKTNDLVSEGSAIYKVITSDEWKLVFQIDEEETFEDLDSVSIEFLKDGITAEGDFETFTSGGNSYGVVSLDKYMIRYATDRYIQIKIVDDSIAEGLIVPKSAVTKNQYYMIPLEYATVGGNTSSYGFLRQITGVDGSSTVEFVIPDIIKKDDEYYYVDMSFFSDGDVIAMPDSSETYQIAAKENLDGVFVSEGGISVFRLAEILGENGSYYVVKPALANGVKLYDQIIRDASDISEGDSVSG